AAPDRERLTTTLADLQAKRHEIEATLSALAAGSASISTFEGLRRNVAELEASTDLLARSLDQRLTAAADADRLMIAAVAAYQALLEKLSRLTDDAKLDLTTGLLSLGETQSRSANGHTLAKLSDNDVASLQVLSDLRAEAILMEAILTEASLATSARQL